MEKISRVEAFPNLVASKEPATVYDVACKSIPELVYLIMQRLNETIEHMNKNDATLQQQLDYVLAQLEDFYLKFDEDLRQEIQIVLQAWIEDGTLEQVISQLVENRAVYPSIAALQQAPNIFQLGAIVELQGYHYAGDGAGHKRIIADKDDGSGVAVGNKWANIVHNGKIFGNWFGMKTTDDFDNADFLQKAINYCNHIVIPKGEYRIGKTIKTRSGMTLEGESRLSTSILAAGDFVMFQGSLNYSTIREINFGQTIGGYNATAFKNTEGYRLKLEHIQFGSLKKALEIQGVFVEFDRCYFEWCQTGIEIATLTDFQPGQDASTMFSIKDSSFVSCGIGLTDKISPNGTAINILVQNTGFEKCTHGIYENVRLWGLTLESCWFEFNTTSAASLLAEKTKVLRNNYLHSSNSIDWRKSTYQDFSRQGGFSELSNSIQTVASTKFIECDSWLEPRGSSEITTVFTADKSNLSVKQNGESLTIPTQATNGVARRSGSFFIGRDGNIQNNETGMDLTITQSSDSTYTVIFPKNLGPSSIITATAYSNDASYDRITLVKLADDQATGLDWGQTNGFRISAKKADGTVLPKYNVAYTIRVEW